jgi:DNA-binding PadR family transcriptional regulator
MRVPLTTEEIAMLKQLEAAGDRGRTISAPNPPAGLRRLVNAGYVAISRDVVLYRITDRGRAALAAARQWV